MAECVWAYLEPLTSSAARLPYVVDRDHDVTNIEHSVRRKGSLPWDWRFPRDRS